MIYTVTFNPSLDYIIRVDHFQAGRINRTVNELILPGGKGINVSIILKNLGYDNTALGFLAGFTGREIQRLLEETGIQTDFIHTVNGTSRINVKMRSDQETEINGRGPFVREEEIEMLFHQLDRLEAEDILVLSGSIPSCIPETIYMDIMKYLDGRGVRIAVDAEKDLLLKVLPYHPFLIKPNDLELGSIFQTAIRSKEDALIHARKLRELGAENVLVSMAEKGAVLITETDEEYQAAAPKGTLRNSVGAGDSMVAGFLAGYLKNHDCREAFRLGVCAGSATAFCDGLAGKAEIETLLSENEDCINGN